ncbi:hypothetical protein NEMIN01_1179 [Nematocida minor]|uniref:uncharacterized protein n=1 Tax=Nematocida minor TaxID=1912983 RepID=UPI00221FFBDA|nr:uncharacterized protein NEMIN01_1179 [Nematocida minor]KAI5190714.1 hypothetical protein NEMIN01_1179 [Nematocida minor]
MVDAMKISLQLATVPIALLKVASALSLSKHQDATVSAYHNLMKTDPHSLAETPRKSGNYGKKKEAPRKSTFSKKSTRAVKSKAAAEDEAVMESLMGSAKQLASFESIMGNKENSLMQNNSLLAQFITGGASSDLLSKGAEYAHEYNNELVPGSMEEEMKMNEEEQDPAITFDTSASSKKSKKNHKKEQKKEQKKEPSPARRFFSENSLRKKEQMKESAKPATLKKLIAKATEPLEHALLSDSVKPEESAKSAESVDMKKIAEMKMYLEKMKKEISQMNELLAHATKASEEKEPTFSEAQKIPKKSRAFGSSLAEKRKSMLRMNEKLSAHEI